MNDPIEQSAILGILQGLTEFLPVSSSGHLALAQTLFGIQEAGLTLSVVLHGGTLLATIAYFRRRLWAIVIDWYHSSIALKFPHYDSPGRDAWLVVFATIPTGIFGLVLHDRVEQWTASPTATGVGFLVTACVLVSTHWARSGSMRSPSIQGALLIGLMQGMAVFPGVSRSGMTIIAALWLGMRSDRAFEFSMLLSIPAVLGAVVLELAGAEGLGGRAWSLTAGAAIAFVVGLAALAMLRRVVSLGRLSWFALWVLPVALATLALGNSLPPANHSSARGSLLPSTLAPDADRSSTRSGIDSEG